MGFAVPIGPWFGDTLRPLLQRRLLDTDHLTGLGLRRDAIESVIDDHLAQRTDHTHRLFALLSLSMWLDWLGDPQPPPPLAA